MRPNVPAATTKGRGSRRGWDGAGPGRLGPVELAADLGLTLGHGLASLGDRGPHELAEVRGGAGHLAADVGRGDLLPLALRPPGHEHRGRRPRAEPEGEPEDP